MAAAVGNVLAGSNPGASDEAGGPIAGRSDDAAGDARAAWAAKANRICAEADDEVDTLPPPRTRVELERFFSSLIEMNKRWNDDLSALGPPPREEKQFGVLVKLLNDDERILDAMLAATQAGENDALKAHSAEYESVGKRQDVLWRSFGATRCADTSFSPSQGPQAADWHA